MKKTKRTKQSKVSGRMPEISLLTEGAKVFDSLAAIVAERCEYHGTIWIATSEKIELFAKLAHDLPDRELLALQAWLNAIITADSYAKDDFGVYLSDIEAYYEVL